MICLPRLDDSFLDARMSFAASLSEEPVAPIQPAAARINEPDTSSSNSSSPTNATTPSKHARTLKRRQLSKAKKQREEEEAKAAALVEQERLKREEEEREAKARQEEEIKRRQLEEMRALERRIAEEKAAKKRQERAERAAQRKKEEEERAAQKKKEEEERAAQKKREEEERAAQKKKEQEEREAKLRQEQAEREREAKALEDAQNLIAATIKKNPKALDLNFMLTFMSTYAPSLVRFGKSLDDDDAMDPLSGACQHCFLAFNTGARKPYYLKCCAQAICTECMQRTITAEHHSHRLEFDQDDPLVHQWVVMRRALGLPVPEYEQ